MWRAGPKNRKKEIPRETRRVLLAAAALFAAVDSREAW